MLNERIKVIINKTLEEIIIKSNNKNNIDEMLKKHKKKIHFIPIQYRVLSGILQSMNIKFGNFIEILMQKLIINENKYEILEEISGKKINDFKICIENEMLIDEYITKCQSNNIDLISEFEILKKNLFDNEQKLKYSIVSEPEMEYITSKHDIDLLFRDKQSNKIYYVEIKYNDDHDTGKFVDINRKLIKTYAYLLNKFDIKNCNEIIPILYYFNNKKMKGNIYIPEKTNILIGRSFFEKFLSISYDELEEYLIKLSENKETIEMFNKMYKNIMKQGE